jgi:hypothetical protein
MVSMHLSYIISVLLFSTKGPSVTVGPSGCTPYSSEGMLGYKKSSGEKHFKKKKGYSHIKWLCWGYHTKIFLPAPSHQKKCF